MNEVMVDLYQISGNEDYLKGAKLFDNLAFFYGPDGKSGLKNNVDTIRTRHANQHLPQIIGSLKIYEATGDKTYYDIADNFMDYALNSYSYAIGGVAGNVTNAECFNPLPNMISQVLHDATPNMCETCATYNMLKLARQLFMFTGDAKYMDYYERAWYNQIAASVDDNCGNTYHIPLDGGSAKSYGNQNMNGFTCCNGTSIESNTKLQDTIYFRSKDDSKIYINMYAPSTLEANGITVTQKTNFPYEDKIKVVIGGGGDFQLLARIPNWATNGYNVKINGVEQYVNPIPSSYVTLGYSWNDGDEIEIEIPMSLHLLKTMDDSAVGSIFYGPILLAGKESGSLSKLRELTINERDLASDIVVDPATLTAAYGDYEFKPFYDFVTDRHSVYFRFDYTRQNYQEVDYSQLEEAIQSAENLEGTFENSAALAEALEKAKAIDEAKNATQRDVDDAAGALVEALYNIGSRLGIISVNGVAEGAKGNVGAQNTVVFNGPKNVKIGLFNENGKGVYSKSTFANDNEWTTTFALQTKGDRVISIYFDRGNGWEDSGMKFDIAISSVPKPETQGTIVSAKADVETAGRNEKFTVTVVTKGEVEKLGVFNEKGAGIGKTVVSRTENGDETTWVLSMSVGSKGARTFSVKVPTPAGEWSDDKDQVTITIK
jgi:hypothetical protein